MDRPRRRQAAGEAWVGATPNIDTHQNREWFGLRIGAHPNAAMQAAWNAHGAAAFSFEVLERIDDERLTPLGAADLLKERERHWRAALDAKKAPG